MPVVCFEGSPKGPLLRVVEQGLENKAARFQILLVLEKGSQRWNELILDKNVLENFVPSSFVL
jgi:hypothetical protein